MVRTRKREVTKAKILESLARSEPQGLAFEELVEDVQMSKSTLANHLPILKDKEYIRKEPDVLGDII